MKSLLIGINAKFIHSNLAIRYLRDYVKDESVEIAEFTINQSLDYILGEVYNKRADIICISCYIWNIDMVKKLVKELKKISPNTFVILGGPEVSYHSEKLMEEYSEVDAIISGEGEKTFAEILMHYKGNMMMKHIKGLTYRDGKIIKNEPREPMNMDELPFVYKDGFQEFENRIIYYETMRGCPFNCQYCLSSIEKGVRFRSFSIVKDELKFFLDNNVMQVKFVDRTFNCRKEHAMNIWKYISENDNGHTNFHFEISADLLDDDTIDFLNTVREGLIQLEIGVQSTNENTIRDIKRKTQLNKLSSNVLKLKKGNNIHLHLDLIAGLPHEGYESFGKSFNDVYYLQPEKLQLGFLKILKGSGMERKCQEFGIKYRDYSPYEILCTKDITYSELQKLKIVEEMVEIYYNSGNFYNTIKYIEQLFNSPFNMYERLAHYWIEKGYYHVNHSKISLYTILFEFMSTYDNVNVEFLAEIIKFDLYLQEKMKKFPYWIKTNDQYKSEIINFYKDDDNILKYLPQLKDYSSKQVSRMAHIEVFKYNIMIYLSSNYQDIIREDTVVLFNYHNRDKMRHNARYNYLKII